ncbi:MAG: FAD-binding oxidoreductase [Woronichinia naegeliana WA131]|jgi:FAD/FMN-containing dehydrogenase|uniref:FAD-binding oxidoreductase n=1 Tax=Woronichinia naegeliana WA131 TaxID=2824559 RepID=A0A977PZT8_9CYAN|nr:MAG: FAD-binding oxidoreductase [Woronichinia naegeliana WA131]
MNNRPDLIADILLQLAAYQIRVITDCQQIQKLSLDYYHFSPVLTRQLAHKRGDLVVFPKTEQEILLVAQLCVQNHIPLTVRGAGTGNYGQCIPLLGGIILDLTDMNRILAVEPGRARVEPGVKMAAIDKVTREIGWELRIAPSTYQTATLGGFIGGGSAGMGSINYGMISDRGNVQALRIVTLENTPQVLELKGDETQPILHAYGTNGIITQIEIALAPTYPWAEVIICFQDFLRAIAFAQDLGDSSGIIKKQIAVHASPIPQYFTALRRYLPQDQSCVLAIVSEYDLLALSNLVCHYQGSITYQKMSGETSKHLNLLEFNWNHTTLLARSHDPSLTYLQVAYGNLARVEQLYRYFGDEVMIHLEFLRANGNVIPAGLPLVKFTNEDRLQEIINEHRSLGASIANPHVYTIEEGGSGEINPDQLAFKKRVDPHGLMNPGKMKTWQNSSTLSLDQKY